MTEAWSAGGTDEAPGAWTSYTEHRDPEIDRIIGGQINEAASRIVADVRPDALVLLGGYARGEGSVMLGPGGPIPMGDYDFLIISKYPRPPPRFRWAEAMRKRFNLQYEIDATSTWKPLLRLAGRRIYFYELKFGSRVLAGDRSVLGLIPIADASEIDLSEGPSVLSNRLISLTTTFNPAYIDADLGQDEGLGRHIVFQAVKSILACGESLLLLSRQYHFSYRERSRRFAHLFRKDFPLLRSRDPGLEEAYLRATEFKMKPDMRLYRNPIDAWFEAKRHSIETLAYVQNRIYRDADGNGQGYDCSAFPRQIIEETPPDALDFLRFNLGSFLSMRSLKGLRSLGISYSAVVRSAIFCHALSISRDGSIDEDLLGEALRTLGRILPAGRVACRESDPWKKWLLVGKVIEDAWGLAKK